jgi:hypothetical protein
MNSLRDTARLAGAVLVEVALVVVLVALGRRPELGVPVGHLGEWLRDGDAATVVVALLRCIALAGAAWLLGSTLLYLVASVSRVPAAVRAVRWSTLPAVRRAVDAACAVSVATSVVLAPAAAGAAGAARASDPPSVSLVRDGHGGGIGRLPADAAPPTTTPIAPVPPTAVSTRPGAGSGAGASGEAEAGGEAEASGEAEAEAGAGAEAQAQAEAEVTIGAGDNLWLVAARHLAATGGRAVADVADAEVAPYWVRVCETNRPHLASGDPNLVFPGERVVLPPVELRPSS